MGSIVASGPELKILPLGGCGEIGLNATLFIDGEDALLVDCGALLGVENAPGVERAVPGFEPLFVPGRRLLGVVLTHGHEDHVGALPALLAELDVPVFGTPLTLALARARLEGAGGRPVAAEARRQARGRLIEAPLGSVVEAGPFRVELIRVTHSIPEAAALCLETRAGRVLHSGDFKLDATPLDGQPTDVARLKALGDRGIDVLLSDSTNAERPGRSGSEQAVALGLDRAIGEAEGRVVVTLVASHLHRLRAIADVAVKHGRRLALVGRAVEESWRLGVERNYLPADPALLIAPEHLRTTPRNRVVAIASGAQGEWLGGLYRMAAGQEAALRLSAGDRLIYSARVIPGHEKAVRAIMNQLARQGVEVINDRMVPVHCSGHASQAEQAELLSWVRPRSFVPVHGERTMLEAHARLGREAGVNPEQVMVIEDGQSVMLSGGRLARGPAEPVSRRPVDASGKVLDWGDVRDRNKIGRGGLVVCSVAIDARGALVAAPALTARGLSGLGPLTARLEKAAREAVVAAAQARVEDAEAVGKGIRSALRATLKDEGRRPEVTVHVVRVN